MLAKVRLGESSAKLSDERRMVSKYIHGALIERSLLHHKQLAKGRSVELAQVRVTLSF